MLHTSGNPGLHPSNLWFLPRTIVLASEGVREREPIARTRAAESDAATTPHRNREESMQHPAARDAADPRAV
ncbi:MAG: hypothetical protein AMXMBFR58_29770 [Phycisphaerae bacterium]